MNTCETCGIELPEQTGRGRPRRYCSDACRKQANRKNLTPPARMAMTDRWGRWRKVVRCDGTTKLPLTIDGAAADSTDPDTWSTFEAAEESGVGDGLGFALGGGSACIDLDHCYDSRGYLADWAKCLIAPVEGKTWIEISPGGDGLHIWGLMPERAGIKVRGIMNAEAYSQGRYITGTVRLFRGWPPGMADRSFVFALRGILAGPYKRRKHDQRRILPPEADRTDQERRRRTAVV